MEPVTLLKDLIKINTTNPPGNEAALLACLEKILGEKGIAFAHQETAPGRGNLLAVLPADGVKTKPPLIMMSHADVVEAACEQWKLPPFEAREEDGYIYGRGAVDTKQLTVMELMAFLELRENSTGRCRDVYFLVTSDEESGSSYGLQWFLDHELVIDGRTLNGRALFTDSDVISEGGGFPVLAGEKEFYLCETGQKACGTVEFKVKARHAKGPFFGSGDGMARAMALVQEIGSLRMDGRRLKTVEQFEEALGGGELSPMMQKILSAMKQNSLTVTMITGRNVNEVKVTCDVRLIPGFGRNDLEAVLEKLSRKWDCDYEIVSLSGGYESNPEGEFLQILEKATLEVRGLSADRAQILPFVSMGSSDGRFLADTGARVYGYSPVLPWDMTFDSAVTMVHGVNERIHRDSVVFGCRVLALAAAEAVRDREGDQR